jgi:hypothetical protein
MSTCMGATVRSLSGVRHRVGSHVTTVDHNLSVRDGLVGNNRALLKRGGGEAVPSQQARVHGVYLACREL